MDSKADEVEGETSTTAFREAMFQVLDWPLTWVLLMPGYHCYCCLCEEIRAGDRVRGLAVSLC